MQIKQQISFQLRIRYTQLRVCGVSGTIPLEPTSLIQRCQRGGVGTHRFQFNRIFYKLNISICMIVKIILHFGI